MSGQIDKCILVFVKYPLAGAVKTRLAADIGGEKAASIYACFVRVLLEGLKDFGGGLKICCDPAFEVEDYRRWLGEGYSYILQRGEGLGERMKNAFEDAFSDGFERVVLVGSDVPDLPGEYVDLAFYCLGRKDVVVGPSVDGGYYLIGFSRGGFLPEVFDGISWSSDVVFKQTVDVIRRYDKKCFLLGQWQDVDTVADLESLLKRNGNGLFGKLAGIEKGWLC